MDHINGIRKMTDNPYLNLYELDATFRNGTSAPYYVASRRKSAEFTKAATHDNHPDGVILYGVYGEAKDRVVLIRQYRYPIDGYVYEFPAGLVEPKEDMLEAGIREMFEETGLDFTPISTAQPFFMSVGMTDESCGTVFGYCHGTPTNSYQEGTEDIQVILADRAECRRILREERVALPCAYMLMHFIATQGDPLSFLQEV
jgi:ADP-ribose pyrophosphatase